MSFKCPVGVATRSSAPSSLLTIPLVLEDSVIRAVRTSPIYESSPVDNLLGRTYTLRVVLPLVGFEPLDPLLQLIPIDIQPVDVQ
ncbi:hypothetical protein GDO81_002851 [Engystomops pustulosus]|uniref:Uncharacterized protein n=1 Tax=Engystomops pustulosus TaxID=76066 RepID=A0AAV7DQ05_ENGPU|nr:hypothetical protein GDO81_002851 [Engystomops pustulosus]